MIIPVVFATDDNYVLPLAVAIQSLKKNKKKNIFLKIHIFYNKLSIDSKKLLLNLKSDDCDLIFLDISSSFKGNEFFMSKTELTKHISIATYFRLFAPIVLSQYEKIIYLDCDIVVKCCLSEIFVLDLQGNLIGGVIHDGSEETKYINAGVLIFNVKNYIKENVYEKCLNYIQTENPTFMDQDAINYVCKGRILFYKNVYNFVSTIIYSKKSILTNKVFKEKDIKILHYLSHKKPWTHKYAPFGKIWWNYAKQTPKPIKTQIKAKYTNLNKEKINYFWYKYYFGSKLKKFFILARVKLSLVLKKIKKK